MTANTSQAVNDAWEDQQQWSHVASRLKKHIVFWRSAALAFAVAGAVLTTLATQVSLVSSLGRVMSGIAALALAVVPVIRGSKLSKERVQGWNRARAASEAVKAEIYLYLTRTPPYDVEDRDDELLKQTDGIIGQVDDLAGDTIGRPDTNVPLPDVEDVASYVRWRVQPQIDDYYRPEAARQRKRLSLFRGVEFTLSGLAAVLGAIAATTHLNRIGVWVAVVTTVGAAITAHIAAARYEHLIISYMSTARQLRSLLRRWEGRSDKNPTAAGKLVRECEEVISRENESWMAAWSQEDESTPHIPAVRER